MSGQNGFIEEVDSAGRNFRFVFPEGGGVKTAKRFRLLQHQNTINNSFV
jgi:hypothetical protein